ncbi:MAG: alpha/beta hydrolase [Brachymonas sp.]
MSSVFKTIAVAAALVAGSATVLADGKTYRMERVSFTSGGETLVGHLYLPKEASGANKMPAAVVTGAWMTIKEQMSGRYAQELAERGVIALAFDFRNWGESGGKERALENPAKKTADIRAAVEFLQARAEVDAQRLGGLGVCASAGYMAAAASNTPAIKSVSFVAPWLHDSKIVDAVYGGSASVNNLIAASQTAQQKFKASGELTLLPAASTSDKSAVMFNVPYYTEPARGMIAKWENKFNVASWEGWLKFDSMPYAPRISQPVLMVHSEAAAIPHGAKQFFSGVNAPKHEKWIANTSQFDFYDGAVVERAADAVAAHLKSAGRDLVAAK